MSKHLKPETSLRKCYWLSDGKLVTPVLVFTNASFTGKVIPLRDIFVMQHL